MKQMLFAAAVTLAATAAQAQYYGTVSNSQSHTRPAAGLTSNPTSPPIRTALSVTISAPPATSTPTPAPLAREARATSLDNPRWCLA